MGGEYDAMMMRDQDQANAGANAQSWQQGAEKHIPRIPGFEHPGALSSTPFPKGAGRGGHFSVDRSGLSTVVANMSKDHARLLADASAFESNAAGSDGTGDWETASNLGINAFNAYTAVTGYFAILGTNYADSTTRLHKSVSNYGDAESGTRASATGVGDNTR
jgi:hypothetical protein